MLRLLLCLCFWGTTASADEYEAARGPAILEIEQALYLMGLKNGAPDESWDNESAAGLETLRQRIGGIEHGEKRFEKVLQLDPLSDIAAETVSLSSRIWDFSKTYYGSSGRRGLLMVYDGPERVFVKPHARSEAGKPAVGYEKYAESAFEWCLQGGKNVRLALELPYDDNGMVDLRAESGTALNRVLNSVILPSLAKSCPGALTYAGDDRQVVLDVYVQGETFVRNLLRKTCDNYIGYISDRSVATFKIPPADPNGAPIVLGTDRSFSGVGYDGAPGGTITLEMVEEEQLFAPRTDCFGDIQADVSYMSQFRNRYGY